MVLAKRSHFADAHDSGSRPRLHEFQELELLKNEANELKTERHEEFDGSIQE
ncbi:MAG: hypothetical protein K6E91_00070 [Butyrivibrio sp.]|nr:hypothetical protein [Butyrivibrio sp.]